MTATAKITATVAPIPAIPANVLDTVARYGDAQRDAETGANVLKSAMPPVVSAALVMFDGGAAKYLGAAHMDALMEAYYGGKANLPATIIQQKSKFKSFVMAGLADVPAGQAVRRAVELCTAAKRVAEGVNDKKEQAKAVRAADKLAAGMWAKACKIVTLQTKVGKVMLDDEALRDVLNPVTVVEDPFAAALEALAKALVACDNATDLPGTGFVGYAEINSAIQNAMSHHDNAMALKASQSESDPVVPSKPVIAGSTNVVVITAAQKAVEIAVNECEDLLEVA